MGEGWYPSEFLVWVDSPWRALIPDPETIGGIVFAMGVNHQAPARQPRTSLTSYMATTQITPGQRRWGSTVVANSMLGHGKYRTVLDRDSPFEGFAIWIGIRSGPAAQHGADREIGAPAENRERRARIALVRTESEGTEPNH